MPFIFTALAILLLAGCAAHSPHNRDDVSRSLEQRTGHALNAAGASEGLLLPSGVDRSDGLTVDEAVAIALWNNAPFQSDLTELGFARADLLEAGLLRNPMLSLLFPVGPKQLEATLSLPIEVLWQRPKRVAIAKLEAERVAENLVQHGLDLAREVHLAYAGLLFAQSQKQIAEENARLRQEIADIAAARLRAGDISALEESASRVEALQARQAGAGFAQEAEICRTCSCSKSAARFLTHACVKPRPRPICIARRHD